MEKYVDNAYDIEINACFEEVFWNNIRFLEELL